MKFNEESVAYRTAKILKKRQSRQVRQSRELQREKRRAAEWLRYLRYDQFPGHSLLQLLDQIKFGSILACEMAVELIKLDPKGIPAEHQESFDQFEAQLKQRRNALINHG